MSVQTGFTGSGSNNRLQNNAMNLTRSAQTDWGPRRLLQCWTGLREFVMESGH
jgi:hypothetical protein